MGRLMLTQPLRRGQLEYTQEQKTCSKTALPLAPPGCNCALHQMPLGSAECSLQVNANGVRRLRGNFRYNLKL